MADGTGDAQPGSSAQEPRATLIGSLPSSRTSPVVLVDYDQHWPALFQREAERIRTLLGDGALLIEHVGSTAVPGLAAKPVIDIDLVVADSSDEAAYLPALEAAGYRLIVREPAWFEHRYMKGPDTRVNLHIFSPDCPEVERMVIFRDWLRTVEGDRALYAWTKRDLAARQWNSVQEYADAKTHVITEILRRAYAGRG